MNEHLQIDINNQLVILKSLVEHRLNRFIWILKKIVKNLEIFAFRLLDEVVSKPSEQGFV